tara:strand:+ start:1202 stop:1564 length:363 start_codon:yes stop_codon:yes gene_type:complete
MEIHCIIFILFIYIVNAIHLTKNAIFLDFDIEPGDDYEIKVSARPPLITINHIGHGIIINYTIPQHIDLKHIQIHQEGTKGYIMLPKLLYHENNWVDEGKIQTNMYKKINIQAELENINF